MKKQIFTISILLYSAICLSQNEYQSQLYSLTERLNTFEKKYVLKKKLDNSFGTEKLELIKDFHRLGEESMQAGMNKDISYELSDLIGITTEIACNRLNILEYYLNYNNDLYKTNYARSKTIFLSFYLKVKALENP